MKLKKNEFRSKSGRFYGVGPEMTQKALERYERSQHVITKQLPAGKWRVTQADYHKLEAKLRNEATGRTVTVKFGRSWPEVGWTYEGRKAECDRALATERASARGEER